MRRAGGCLSAVIKHWNMLDLIILVTLGIGLYVGYSRGVIRQLGSLAGMLIGLVACQLFGDAATQLTASIMGVNETIIPTREWIAASVIGNVVLFVVVWWGVSLCGHLLHGLVNAVHLGVVNAFIGSLFMGLQILIVASLLINLWLVKDPSSTIVSSGGPVVKIVAGLGPKLLGMVEAV